MSLQCHRAPAADIYPANYVVGEKGGRAPTALFVRLSELGSKPYN